MVWFGPCVRSEQRGWPIGASVSLVVAGEMAWGGGATVNLLVSRTSAALKK